MWSSDSARDVLVSSRGPVVRNAPGATPPTSLRNAIASGSLGSHIWAPRLRRSPISIPLTPSLLVRSSAGDLPIHDSGPVQREGHVRVCSGGVVTPSSSPARLCATLLLL